VEQGSSGPWKITINRASEGLLRSFWASSGVADRLMQQCPHESGASCTSPVSAGRHPHNELRRRRRPRRILSRLYSAFTALTAVEEYDVRMVLEYANLTVSLFRKRGPRRGINLFLKVHPQSLTSL
jgi:hypothetical protein